MRLPVAVWGRRDLAWATAACAAVVAGCLAFGGRAWPCVAVAGAAVLVWLALANFFRDPERAVPAGECLVLSPADGVVKDIAEVEEPRFLGEKASRLGIFLSPLNVHVNRMPMEGRAVQVFHVRGKMLPAYDPLAITENEAAAVGLEVLGGRARLVVRQVTGAVARRIVCPVVPGDRYAAGERYGMIKFGSRTEVWVPKSVPVRWTVAVGDRVKGGATVLGVLEVSSDAAVLRDTERPCDAERPGGTAAPQAAGAPEDGAAR